METKRLNLRNDIVSIIIDKLLSTISCGGCTAHHKKTHPKSDIEPITSGSDNRVGSEKLADLLSISDSLTAVVGVRGREKEEDGEVVLTAEMKRKKEWLEELRSAVRDLTVERGGGGAQRVRRLAKEDVEARVTLGMLGAIPPLVAMICDDGVQNDEDLIQALFALLNLSIGNDLNKAAIVQAGAVHNMLKKIESSNGSLDPSVSEAIVANFLALSALDSNKSIIGASGAIPFLVGILMDANKTCNYQAKQDALRALYNLSILPSNVPLIIETDLIKFLISTLGNMEVSERILSILSNIVSVSEGRRAISGVPDSFPTLIDVLDWSDSPGCQEKASYVLMVMAHKSYRDRQTMIEAGIGTTLLELTLLGSTLAQKRASRILECLSVDKGKQVSQSFNGGSSAAISAPIYAASSSCVSANMNKEDEGMMSEEKKAVKQLVQQSLQSNMKKIVKRANLPQDFVPSEHLKTLTTSSTSKSLPF